MINIEELFNLEYHFACVLNLNIPIYSTLIHHRPVLLTAKYRQIADSLFPLIDFSPSACENRTLCRCIPRQ